MYHDIIKVMILGRKNWILLKELTTTDFKLRYQGSVLGYLWALLRPMLMFLILYLVFAKFLKFDTNIPNYPVYLLTGVVLWSFFTECTNQGIHSIVLRGDLLRKLNFPKWIIVVSATATALINLAINLSVVIIFALLRGVPFHWSWLLTIFPIIELYLLSLGLALLLGAINVKFRDIASIWDVIIQALFYAVPIIYPLAMVIKANILAAKILMLNPIAQAVQDVRYLLITSKTVTVWSLINNWWFKIIPIVIVAALLIFAIFYFNRRAKYFAEEV